MSLFGPVYAFYDEVNCPICQAKLRSDDLARDEIALRIGETAAQYRHSFVSTCGHEFHEACARSWARAKQNNVPCPSCRVLWTQNDVIELIGQVPEAPVFVPWHLSEEGQAVLRGLRENSYVELDLTGNELGPEDGAAIVDALRVNTTLTWLDLTDNELGPEGGAAIADALRVNTTLTKLFLVNNELGPGGGAAIADALRFNTTLTLLYLSNNELGPEGGAAIADALRVNTTLTGLNLNSNELGPGGGAAIADALRVNTTLTSLNLSGNELGPGGSAAIADALRVNTNISVW